MRFVSLGTTINVIKGGDNILAKLKGSLKNSFNIYDNYNIGNYHFDFMGELNLTNTKFFLSKDKVIYSYDNNEYLFAKEINNLSKEYLDNTIFPFTDYALKNIVKTNESHMSSIVTLFINSNSIDPDIKNNIRKFKKRKSYKFGLQGYASTRIIVIDKSNNKLIYNSEAKEIINYYKEVLK